MFRRLMQVYRDAGARQQTAAVSRRCRPALEQLESRLTPSLAPLPAAADVSAPPKGPSAHVADAPSATREAPASLPQGQVFLALMQTARPRAELANASGALAPAVPPDAVPPPQAGAQESAAADLLLDRTTFVALPAEPDGPPAPDLLDVPAAPAPARPTAPVEPLPACEVRLDRMTSAGPARGADVRTSVAAAGSEEESEPALLDSTRVVVQADSNLVAVAKPADIRNDMPLLAWVAGMASLMVLRWESRTEESEPAVVPLGRRRRKLAACVGA